MKSVASSKHHPDGVVILCDFDKTATPTNVFGYIYDLFSNETCRHYRQLWRDGLISSTEEMEVCCTGITASEEEMLASLKDIELDPGLAGLVHWAEQRDFEFAILSDGLDWYIRAILERSGLYGVKIFSNQIEFTADGIRLSYPWYDPKYPHCGTSKRSIIQGYQERMIKTVFIGDGLSDFEASHVADRVYAKTDLLIYCRENSIPAVEFTTLDEVLADLQYYFSDHQK